MVMSTRLAQLAEQQASTLSVTGSTPVADAHKALSAADDARQALYREAQLALRAVIGGRELDQFLADKDAVAKELEEVVRQRVAALGLEVISVDIRDQPSVGARSCRAT